MEQYLTPLVRHWELLLALPPLELVSWGCSWSALVKHVIDLLGDYLSGSGFSRGAYPQSLHWKFSETCAVPRHCLWPGFATGFQWVFKWLLHKCKVLCHQLKIVKMFCLDDDWSIQSKCWQCFANFQGNQPLALCVASSLPCTVPILKWIASWCVQFSSDHQRSFTYWILTH